MASQSHTTNREVENAVEPEEVISTPMQPQEKSPMLMKDEPSNLPARRFNALFLSTWVFEIASVCLALAVLATVVAILGVYNGHPNPLWTGGITLNTVISFASMLFRISLMVPVASCISQLSWVWLSQDQRPLYDVVRFDEASRSPYGSFKLLFSHHVRSFVSIGAIVSILSVVLGPFFQQSIVFYSDSVEDTTAVSYASYASDYNASVGFVPNIGFEVTSLRTPLNMKTAVYNGFFSSGAESLPDPPFSCPSGNCTWDPFPTLALGVQCRDAPEQLHLNCSGYDSDARYPDRCMIVGTNQPGNSTRLFIGPIEDWSTVFHFAETYVPYADVLDPLLSTIPMGGSVDIEWIRATDLLVSPEYGYGYGYIGRNSTIESRQCKIYTCLQEILARVENGAYSEAVLQETINGTRTDNPLYGKWYGQDYTYTYVRRDGSSENFTITSRQQYMLLDDIQSPFED